MAESVKTSITHPLEIQCVTLPENEGVIGMTLCPGRKGSSLAGGSWDRDLDADLDLVRRWEPDFVVSLLDESEYPLLGISNFKLRVERSGLPWVYAPIRDGGTPGKAFFEVWTTAGPRIRNALRNDGRVLIHCRAGLGRTGLVAACLLIDFGASAEEAIIAVREARPHTVETQEQEAYISSYAAPLKQPERESAIEGTIYGGAIGDALGSAFTLLTAREIATALGEPFAWRYCSSLPGSLLGQEAGMSTEGTAMALSVASWIALSNDLSSSGFETAFWHDLDRELGRFGSMFWNGAPDSTTVQAIGRLNVNARTATATRGTSDFDRNSAAIRAHPVGVLSDRDHVLETAANQARVTHHDPVAIAEAQAVAVIVHDALAGLEPTLEPPEGIVEPSFVAGWKKAHARLRRGSNKLPKHLLDIDASGPGTVAAAHAISWLFHEDPNRAIAAAAASGGDPGSLASIVGAFVGARYGLGALRSDWVECLASKDEIQKAIARLACGRKYSSEKSRLATSGTIKVKNDDVHYVFHEGKVVLRMASVDADFLADFSEAIRCFDPGRAVVVHSALTVADVLDVELHEWDLMYLFDRALQYGVDMLANREPGRESHGHYGAMGSEYRSFLVSISECAERYLVFEFLRPDTNVFDPETRNKRRLAEELAFSARSVNFAMRLGIPQILITAAKAVQSLAFLIPVANDDLVKLRGF